MTEQWSELPDQFWHVAVKAAGSKEHSVANDLDRETLLRTIVQPWRAGRPVTVAGRIVSPANPPEQIRIALTTEPQSYYANAHNVRMREAGIADMATNRRLLPVSSGRDMTFDLLFAEEPERDVGTAGDADVRSGFVFIAMPMAEKNPLNEDVHDAIKAAAIACGMTAERVDDVESNERITDRVLESIRRAEFVIADLTDARPNVFYEAGYAQGLEKTPIYIAREGTNPEFDLKDYPIIFFRNMRELRTKLERRLRAIAEQRA